MDLSPRAVIAGRYRVDTKVGAGGMGEVWSGEHVTLGVRIAVKTLLPAAAVNHEVVARFKREALLLGRIRSDHVARVVDFVADDVYGLVLVMEFVEGDPLSRILQERPMTVEESIELGVDIACSLKDLHASSIIHRDLKPGNIILKPMPDGHKRAVVVDFGVSRIMADKDKDEDEELTGITRADMAVGTIEYMAPEQILNSRNVTPGSDIYAAGAILFRAVAGRHIFGNVQSDAELAQKKLTQESSPLPLQRNDKIAEAFAKVVAKMLKRRPSERYKNADEVLADLVPVRDMARAATQEVDSPTIDAAAGLPQAAVAAVPAPAAAAAVPASGPSAPSTSVSTGSSSALALAPPKRGIPPVVTIGLVAAALVGGLFIGPRLMSSSSAPASVTADAASLPQGAATQAPAAPTAPAAVTATAEPPPAATAEADAGAPAPAETAPAATPPAFKPGPLPKPKPLSKPAPVEPKEL